MGQSQLSDADDFFPQNKHQRPTQAKSPAVSETEQLPVRKRQHGTQEEEGGRNGVCAEVCTTSLRKSKGTPGKKELCGLVYVTFGSVSRSKEEAVGLSLRSLEASVFAEWAHVTAIWLFCRCSLIEERNTLNHRTV